MSILNILTYPNDILAIPTKPVTDINEGIINAISDMGETMYYSNGVGLAAIQAGIRYSMIVYDETEERDQRNFKELINPRIIKGEGEVLSKDEGCLSVPDFRADVKRFSAVQVEGFSKEGKPIKIDAEGLLAIIMQHEIDHLNGILFIDRIGMLKREMYKKKIKRLLKKQANKS
ncbi:MAG: peptide deformylase [Desulfobacterales bacterium]|nr:peptide deformylase [Desulfobacterales bacterium]